jgi:hypothetical protein
MGVAPFHFIGCGRKIFVATTILQQLPGDRIFGNAELAAKAVGVNGCKV